MHNSGYQMCHAAQESSAVMEGQAMGIARGGRTLFMRSSNGGDGDNREVLNEAMKTESDERWWKNRGEG